jgi:two-component system, cell cycle sensor histidine kinase and response regulator CckA
MPARAPARPASHADRVRDLERQLRASERRLRAFALGVRDGAFCELDADGRVASWNDAAARLTGYAAAEVVGFPADLLYSPEDVGRRQPAHDLALAARDGRCEREGWCLRRDGSRFWAHVALVALHDDDGRVCGYARVARDLGELREAEGALRATEERLRQAAKMEAVGQLAGGVAHDFNNLLTTVGGHAQLLLKRLPPGDALRRSAEQIAKAADRAAEVTRQLLAFSRKQVLQPRVLSLNAVATETAALVQRLLGEHVRLATALDDRLPPVKADPTQIGQVLLNLVVNARDAMPDGGTITVTTRAETLGAGHVRDGMPIEAGAWAVLAVADTGVGMSADVQSHVFEPFFTTKEAGKGTGLGLSTVYGIVKQSGGYVWVTSAVGRGTTFEVWLPAVPGDVDPRDLLPTPARGVALAAPGGRETVLLAEDEGPVREFVRDVLADAGYRVLDAEDPASALRLAAAHDGALHLLLTDVVMPGGTGRRLAESLLRARPAARVLYMSGYTDHTVFRHGLLEEGTPFLQKPFTPDALLAKVREALDG